ncbi:MAG: DUF1315 family protein [Pseudomonadota bacterium]
MKPQNFEELLGEITPEAYENLKEAVELSRWQDGQRLTAEQQAHCMQLIIAYELRNVPEDQRSGFISDRCKSN